MHGRSRAVPRIGVFGGTFDPVHIGHLVAAAEVRATLALDVVVLVPARTPPHKIGVPMSAAEDRLAMLAAVTEVDPGLAISRADLDRPGPHFTVDMLDLVRAERGVPPDAEMWFVLGADSLEDLPTWRDPVGIAARARLAVIERPGFAPDMDALERVVPGLSARVDGVPVPLIGVSASDIRRRAAEDRPIRYQVPDAVAEIIRRRGLYRSQDGLL